MYCIKCGQQLPDGAKFCSQCGCEIAESSFVLDTKYPTVSSKITSAAKEIVVDDESTSGIGNTILAAGAVAQNQQNEVRGWDKSIDNEVYATDTSHKSNEFKYKPPIEAVYWTDEYGVEFSLDREHLVRAPETLWEYVIPKGTVYVDEGAFEDCRLDSVTIPKSVTKIEKNAFRNTSLSSITIPNSVRFIGEDAFRDTRLTTIITPKYTANFKYYSDYYYGVKISESLIISSGNPLHKQLYEIQMGHFPYWILILMLFVIAMPFIGLVIILDNSAGITDMIFGGLPLFAAGIGVSWWAYPKIVELIKYLVSTRRNYKELFSANKK